MILRRLPRLCRVGAITTFSRDKLCVFQGFADNSTQRFRKSASVIVFALVKSKRLLVQIPEQMKRLHIDVSSVQSAFEKRPKVFHPIRVYLALRVTNGMVRSEERRVGKEG